MGGHTDQNGRTKKKQVRSTVDATYFDHVNVFNLVRLKKQKKSRIFFYKFRACFCFLVEIKMSRAET